MVAKLDSTLTSLLASTYLGGTGEESGYVPLVLDSSGNVYVSGPTESVDFPTTPDAYDTTHNGDWDVVVVKLDANLSSGVPSTTVTNVIATPDNTEVYPGDPVAVDVSVQGGNNVYAGQASCSVDPATLEVQNGVFGDFFDAVNRLVAVNQLDAETGTWFGAISQQNPAGPLSGDGLFATVTYSALNPGTTSMTCDALFSDRDGFTQTVSFSGADITVLPFEIMNGTVVYQGRLEQAGIDITVTGPVTLTALTDSEGAFTFDQLKAGDYEVKVDADGYLPRCTTLTVNKGEPLTLPATILLGGDLNGDEQIGIDDATLLTANFGQSNAAADINGDGIVNVQDLAILAGNYDITGCQPWE